MKKVLILSLLIMGILSLIGCEKKEEQTEEVSQNSEEIEAEYEAEMKVILDEAVDLIYVNINENVAKQMVEFSHEIGFGTIENLDTTGCEFYIDNETEIVTWRVLVRSADEFFYVDIQEGTDVIYGIMYNDECYYLKDGAELVEE